MVTNSFGNRIFMQPMGMVKGGGGGGGGGGLSQK
jgi:hypothetical protein